MEWLPNPKAPNMVQVMSEPRKIVLILGNGFDLDLGLKTSYKDFWETKLCPKTYPAPLIQHLNNKWPNKITVKWFDLENELFYYYDTVIKPGLVKDVVTEKEREFIRTIIEPIWNLGEYGNDNPYIISLTNKGVIQLRQPWPKSYYIPDKEDLSLSILERDQIAFEKIKLNLKSYIRYIENAETYKDSFANRVRIATEKAADNGDFVDVYTFNYTKIECDRCNVYHVHGSCDNDNIIIGTGDNAIINSDYDFLYKSFDPKFYPPDISSSLKRADEVIIFGHSIGENDRQYFKQFFKQQASYTQNSRKRITIFTRDRDSEIEIKRALQNMTDNNLSTLSSQNTIEYFHTSDSNYNYEKLKAFFVRLHLSEKSAEDIIDCINKHLRELSNSHE